MSSEHNRCHEVIPDENQNEAEHNRFGGRLADSGGSRNRVEALVTANPRDNQTEAEGFEKAAPYIAEHYAALHLREIASRRYAEEPHANQVRAVNPDNVEDSGQQRH